MSRNARVVVMISGHLAVAGCAGEAARIVGPGPTVVWERAAEPVLPVKPAPMTPDEARNIAEAHDAAHHCEATARALYEKDKPRGWAVMEQCVRRSDFTDLEGLTTRPWLPHLLASPDMAMLVGHVIAARGGDVQNDLRICRRARVPVFSLKAASSEPDSYKGRFVLMRGSPRGGRVVDGARTVELAETRVMAQPEWVAAGPRTSTVTETNTREGGAASPSREHSEGFRRNEGPRVEVLHNVSVDTGLEIVVDVGDDPFLEPGSDYVMVLRFEGTREAVNGTVLEETPVATVLGYHEPASGMFARLGR